MMVVLGGMVNGKGVVCVIDKDNVQRLLVSNGTNLGSSRFTMVGSRVWLITLDSLNCWGGCGGNVVKCGEADVGV